MLVSHIANAIDHVGTVMRNIDLIRQVISASENNRPHVLGCLNINVPDFPRRHAPCPACGAKIDSGSMTTGAVASSVISAALVMADLIKRVNNCDTTEAALLPLMFWVLITGQRKHQKPPARNGNN